MSKKSKKTNNNIPTEMHQFFSGVGKTLLVKGNPGSGKTIFSLALLDEVCENKNGIYFSTRIELDHLYDQFPWIKDVFLDHNLIDVTELDPTNGLSFLKNLYEKSIDVDLDNPMVVIDSWEAIVLNLNDEANKLEHKITAFARKTATNIVLVAEYSGVKSLDYLVDGVIELSDVEIHGEAHLGDVWYGGLETRNSREICIEKLRGTHIKQKKYTYSLYRGRFQYFEPFLPEPLEFLHNSIEDPDEFMISSGNRDFDEILGGGFSKGSFNLFEMEHGIDQRYTHLLASIISNVILKDKGMILFPVGGKEINNLKKELLEKYPSNDSWIVRNFESGRKNEIHFDCDLHKTLKKAFGIRKKKPEKAFVYVIGLDLFEYYMGHENAIKLIEKTVDHILNDNDILIGIVKRPQQIIDIISHIADKHFVFKDLNGSLCMYGMRPKTGIYNIALSDIELIFTPIV